MVSYPLWGPCMGQRPLRWTEIGPTNDPSMIWDEFEIFCKDWFWRWQTKTRIFTHFSKFRMFIKKHIHFLERGRIAKHYSCTLFFCHTIWFYVTQSRNLTLQSLVGVTQSLWVMQPLIKSRNLSLCHANHLKSCNLSSSHANSHQVTQPLLKSRKPPQVTQPLLKSHNPPHQLTS